MLNPLNYLIREQNGMKEDYWKLKKEMEFASHEKIAYLKMEMQIRQLEFQFAMKQWKTYLNGPCLA